MHVCVLVLLLFIVVIYLHYTSAKWTGIAAFSLWPGGHSSHRNGCVPVCVYVCVRACVRACVRECVREMYVCRQYFVTIRIDAAHCYLTTLVLYSCSTIWNTLITCECAILGMPGLVLVTSYLSAVRPVCAQSLLFLLRDSTFSAV